MKIKKFITTTIIVITLIIIFSTAFFLTSNYSSENIESNLESNDIVKVEEINEGYYFDGPGEIALIFYPGAKVEETAYAPLMYKLAENKIDCFLLKMPFKLAIFGQNKAKKIIKKYDYDTWNIGGHSLGGAMASLYAYDNPDKIENIFLLGSYSTKNLREKNINTYYIYGSNDKIINKEKLKESQNLIKEYDEFIIEGGNHANFGYYGPQKKDGKPTITKEEQIDITVNKIKEILIKEN